MRRDSGTMTTTRTTCPYCGVGCGVLATPRANGTVDIKGDPEHPANLGRLCSKGAALGETLSLDDRLLHPMVAGKRASWNAALDLVARTLGETIATHGPDSVAFYVSGQILTEDYYVANKLMKGFIGSANIDTNSRLCMASTVAGQKRAFGSDTVPGCYEDMELADLVVLVGSNLAWCHPVLFQRLVAAREARGTRVVVVDPRRTATADIADMHLALRPGSDVALFNGLLRALADGNAVDKGWVAQHTAGLREALATAREISIDAIARVTGITPPQLRAFYDLFIGTERVVTVFSQGVNQSTSGTDKVNAIINCHLASARVGRPGMGPFSVTGQPNAMGGREVGGLANMLAAHMELANPDHRRVVQDFWRAPRIADKPGLKAVDLFRAAADGRIKAIWIMATNPVDSMPEADSVRAALTRCPFVVVSDVTRHTDTTALAHVLLPSLAWGEKSGTVTNSERRISRQRPFLASPGEARSDWWQMAEVAKRMGFAAAFAWTAPHEIFAEYAALTARANDGVRDLDLGDMCQLDRDAYDALEPSQWPRRRARLFGDGKFYTSDRRARFVATPYRAPAMQPNAAYPFVLNTGRVRDQWHTMTRSGKTPRLTNHIAEPYVEIHPADAEALGLKAADIAEVESPHGRALLRVLASERQRRGSVFAPIHWTEQFAGCARIDALIASSVDPVSGQPELKAMPVAVRKAPMRWYGFAVSRAKPGPETLAYWALAPAAGGWRLEFADQNAAEDNPSLLRRLLDLAPDTALLSYQDARSGTYRCAAFDGDTLIGAAYIAPSPVAVSRTWLAAQLGGAFTSARDRLTVLSGRPASAEADKGAIVCACFDVGRNQIARSIANGCVTIAAVGAATTAGTNCGSCRTEIGRMIDASRISKAG
jgi:assimilatory nitrate reductase catalytic subunit